MEDDAKDHFDKEWKKLREKVENLDIDGLDALAFHLRSTQIAMECDIDVEGEEKQVIGVVDILRAIASDSYINMVRAHEKQRKETTIDETIETTKAE